MKVVVCPDSFKGTMTAVEAARAIRDGVMEAVPDAKVVMLPVGDGGEGTVDAIASALSGVEKVECRAVDALRRPVKAAYAIRNGTTAMIESASASGLTLISPDERNIMKADTYGTGLLLADARKRGIHDFIVCMGGTATCDGGYGALQAMIDSGEDFSTDVKFTLLCDVENPLCGPDGAAAVFGPQKGATPQTIPLLEERLAKLSEEYGSRMGIDVAAMKYAGAAGGLAGMLMACFGAKPVSGIEKVLELLEFEKQLKDADLVITGEGRGDATTLSGKAPAGILKSARRVGVPVVLACGRIGNYELLSKAGFDSLVEATPDSPHPDVTPAGYLREAVRKRMSAGL